MDNINNQYNITIIIDNELYGFNIPNKNLQYLLSQQKKTVHPFHNVSYCEQIINENKNDEGFSSKKKLYIVKSSVENLTNMLNDQFYNEFLLAQFASNNNIGPIVRSHGISNNGAHYIIMDKWETLEHYLESQNSDSSLLPSWVYSSLIANVHKMHEFGILHMDLYLRNIVINTIDKKCAIIDFGCAVQFPYSLPPLLRALDWVSLCYGTLRTKNIQSDNSIILPLPPYEGCIPGIVDYQDLMFVTNENWQIAMTMKVINLTKYKISNDNISIPYHCDYVGMYCMLIDELTNAVEYCDKNQISWELPYSSPKSLLISFIWLANISKLDIKFVLRRIENKWNVLKTFYKLVLYLYLFFCYCNISLVFFNNGFRIGKTIDSARIVFVCS